MLVRTLLAFTLLIFWPFTGHAPALTESRSADPRQSTAVLSLWIDPSPLPHGADAESEARVFEQTLTRTVEIFFPIKEASRTAVHAAAAAFSDRKPVLLQVSQFESGSPVVEFISQAVQPSAAAAVLTHRQWESAQRGADDGIPVIELFVDVDALRREFLDSFASGRAGRVIHALGIPNARTLALHGRWVPSDKVPLVDPDLPLPPASRRIGDYAAMKGPPLIRMDLSWNSRSDEPTTIRGINVAASHWPVAQLRMEPPPAPFLCLFRANFRAWLESAIKIRAAWLDPMSAGAIEESCAAWLKGNRPAVDRIIGAVPAWLVVHPSTRGPEWFIAQAPLRAENASPDPIVREMDQLLRRQFADQIRIIPDGGSRFSAPVDWPVSVIGWNPAPRPALSTLHFHIDLRGGAADPAK